MKIKEISPGILEINRKEIFYLLIGIFFIFVGVSFFLIVNDFSIFVLKNEIDKFFITIIISSLSGGLLFLFHWEFLKIIINKNENKIFIKRRKIYGYFQNEFNISDVDFLIEKDKSRYGKNSLLKHKSLFMFMKNKEIIFFFRFSYYFIQQKSSRISEQISNFLEIKLIKRNFINKNFIMVENNFEKE